MDAYSDQILSTNNLYEIARHIKGMLVNVEDGLRQDMADLAQIWLVDEPPSQSDLKGLYYVDLGDGSYDVYLVDSTGKVTKVGSASQLPVRIILNGMQQTRVADFYAPETAGTEGYHLVSMGEGMPPRWAKIPVKDVQDNKGTSVVDANGIAHLEDMGKVKDVQVNHKTIVDEDGIANFDIAENTITDIQLDGESAVDDKGVANIPLQARIDEAIDGLDPKIEHIVDEKVGELSYVKDVRVDGFSVVSNKIADIDLTPYMKKIRKVSSIPAAGLKPNTLYSLGNLGADTSISLQAGIEEYNDYMIEFKAVNAFNITWPSGVLWVDGEAPTIEAGKFYQISIIDGLGLWASFE